MFNLWFKAKMGMDKIKNKAVSKKKKGIDGFVVSVIIIIIAVAIGLLFRDQLATWFKEMMGNLTTQSGNLMQKPTP